jgi:hypothetical protein
MLGEGIVSFGVAVLVSEARKRNASAKIGWSSRTFSRTASPAVTNAFSPSALCMLTRIFSSVFVMPPSW